VFWSQTRWTACVHKAANDEADRRKQCNGLADQPIAVNANPKATTTPSTNNPMSTGMDGIGEV
jgi:hypothetical protein